MSGGCNGGDDRLRVVEGNLLPGPDVDPREAEPERLAVALAPPAVIALEDAAAVCALHLERRQPCSPASRETCATLTTPLIPAVLSRHRRTAR